MEIYTNISEPIVGHYVTLVKAGRRTIDQVPERLREEVANLAGISLAPLELEAAIAAKIEELSKTCNTVIENGTTVTLSDGDYTFSFTLADQNNIKTAFDMALSTKMDVPYHADGEGCRLFSYTDIITIYIAEQNFIVSNTTYFNQLKLMVSAMTDVNEVNAVEYSKTELTGEYKTNYDTMLKQSTDIIAKILETNGIEL